MSSTKTTSPNGASNLFCAFCGEIVHPLVVVIAGRERGYPGLCQCLGAQQDRQQREIQALNSDGQSLYQKLLTEAGVDRGKLARMSLATWEITHSRTIEIINGLNNYDATGSKNWLYFWSNGFGSGKTHMAVAILKSLLEQHQRDIVQGTPSPWRGLLADWSFYCQWVKDSWDDSGNTGPTEAQIWSAMRGREIVILDDLDKQEPTKWALGKLFNVIQFRATQEKPLIITANYSLDKLQAAWDTGPEYIKKTGGAILSRISGQLWAEIEFNLPDHRQRD